MGTVQGMGPENSRGILLSGDCVCVSEWKRGGSVLEMKRCVVNECYHNFIHNAVPSPRKSGLVHACTRIYGKWSVNVFVNGLSHIAMGSTEAVYK